MHLITSFLKIQKGTKESELEFFRRRILRYVLFIASMVVTVVLVPSLVAAVSHGLWNVVAFDLAVYFALLVLMALSPKLHFVTVSRIFGLMNFLVGFVIIIMVGSKGAGLIWLSSVPIIWAVLLGFRGGLNGLILNFCGYFTLTVLLWLNESSYDFMHGYDLYSWTASAANALALNVLSALPTMYLVRQIEQVLGKQKRLLKAYLQQTNKLKRANESLDRYIYGLSHDIRGPVTNILGLSQLLKDTDDLVEKEEYGKLIKESADRLDNLLGALIHFYQGRKLKRVIEPITFYDFVQRLAEHLNIDISYPKTTILYQFDRKLSLNSDKFRLGTILLNLMSNALKFSQTAEQPEICIQVEEQKNVLLIHVIDNGPGIAAEHKEKIFNLFHRAHTENIKGTGVGLYIAKMAAEDLEGKLTLTSEINKGSTFTLEFPRTLGDNEVLE